MAYGQANTAAGYGSWPEPEYVPKSILFRAVTDLADVRRARREKIREAREAETRRQCELGYEEYMATPTEFMYESRLETERLQAARRRKRIADRQKKVREKNLKLRVSREELMHEVDEARWSEKMRTGLGWEVGLLYSKEYLDRIVELTNSMRRSALRQWLRDAAGRVRYVGGIPTNAVWMMPRILGAEKKAPSGPCLQCITKGLPCSFANPQTRYMVDPILLRQLDLLTMPPAGCARCRRQGLPCLKKVDGHRDIPRAYKFVHPKLQPRTVLWKRTVVRLFKEREMKGKRLDIVGDRLLVTDVAKWAMPRWREIRDEEEEEEVEEVEEGEEGEEEEEEEEEDEEEKDGDENVFVDALEHQE